MQTPRRPTAGKRTTSSAAQPHRGGYFSVDDDTQEVDSDLQLERTASRPEGSRQRPPPRQDTTIRRRGTAQPPALRTVESDEREEPAITTGNDAAATSNTSPGENGDSEETLHGEEEEEEEETPSPDEEDADLSDAESFTLKDRQEAINETHPFGIRIWKPALYKKNRSVQRNAEGDIHSAPGGNVSRWLFVFNALWTILFGWWLAAIAGLGGIVCTIFGLFRLRGCHEYGWVLLNLSQYLFYPFGKCIKMDRDEAYLEEDEGEGRSITDYQRWQTGDIEEGRLFFGPADINRSLIGRRRDEVEGLDETDSLLGRQRRQDTAQAESAKTRGKKRFFGRGTWNAGRVIFFLSFYFLLTPFLFLVSLVCWFFVFTIPMGKVTLLLFYHLRRHPLALTFESDVHYQRVLSIERGSSILLCTYRAVGLKYWKYTIDGTNIFLINLLGLVVFVILDYFVFYEALGIDNWVTNLGFIFVLALASIIPLAYFIGQAVASISAQSSMGVGATINAFFATIVEVFLYCVALKEGKSQLVEGSIVGSIFAGILFLPGVSMCFGAIKRKTQRFNVKSAGVTSTMLLFAVIGAFGPTLFYQIFGSHQMQCHQCIDYGPFPNAMSSVLASDRDCRRCYFTQTPAIKTRFFEEAVRPFVWFATLCLFLSYVVGLLFTLRTHAAVIWNNEPDEKREVKAPPPFQHTERQSSISAAGGMADQSRVSTQRHQTPGSLPRDNVRDSQMYKRILNQSLKQAGVRDNSSASALTSKQDDDVPETQSQALPKGADGDSTAQSPIASKFMQRLQGLSAEDNRTLVQGIAEMAATAATVATRDATKAPRRASIMATTGSVSSQKQHHSGSSKDPKDGKESNKHSATGAEPSSLGIDSDIPTDAHHTNSVEGHVSAPEEGGHNAPNWSRTKSATILLTATIAYAIIAEVLVDTVDSVLSNVDVDEKFLGITLFALVPNTTEFLNAIAFAMNGNVALSMEIGSSYALQVMLLQIPCIVIFSGVYSTYFLPQDLSQDEVLRYTFPLIFPQWDMVTVILGVFLMGWVVGEGKSNYFKGSILIFTYLVFVVGFWFSGYHSMDVSAID